MYKARSLFLRRIARSGIPALLVVVALLVSVLPVSAATAAYTLTVPTTITGGGTFTASLAKSGAPSGSSNTWTVIGGVKVSGCGTNATTCTVKANKIATTVSATGRVSNAKGSVTVVSTNRSSAGQLLAVRRATRATVNSVAATTVNPSSVSVLAGQTVALTTAPSGTSPFIYATSGAGFTYSSGTASSQSPTIKMTRLANTANRSYLVTHKVTDATGNSIAFTSRIAVTNSTGASTVVMTSGGSPLGNTGMAGASAVANITVAPGGTAAYPFSYRVTRTKVTATGGAPTGATVVATGSVPAPATSMAASITLPTIAGYYRFTTVVSDALGSTKTVPGGVIHVSAGAPSFSVSLRADNTVVSSAVRSGLIVNEQDPGFLHASVTGGTGPFDWSVDIPEIGWTFDGTWGEKIADTNFDSQLRSPAIFIEGPDRTYTAVVTVTDSLGVLRSASLPITFTPAAVGRINASVVDSATGDAVTDALVVVCSTTDNPDFEGACPTTGGGVPSYDPRSFADGDFLAPGDYVVFAVNSPSHAPSNGVAVTVAAHEASTATIPVTAAVVESISGFVLDGVTPIPNAFVSIVGDLWYANAYGEAGWAWTDDHGIFVFVNLPSGAYQLSVGADGYVNKERTLSYDGGTPIFTTFHMLR